MTITSDIAAWVATLPYWEQAAFNLILRGKDIRDTDVDLLVDYLLIENNLAAAEGELPKLEKAANGATSDESSQYKLVSLSNLRNINALIPGQFLQVGDQLTAVFGENGSGKSGYARVLSSAGFSRGDKDILPDINKPYDPDVPQLADIEIARDGKIIKFEHRIGNPRPELASFYTFDTTSVLAHLTKENIISFSPAGLSYLRQLATLTDAVRAKLAILIRKRTKPNPYPAMFVGNSSVSEKIGSLFHGTDTSVLQKMATISAPEQKQWDDLRNRLTTIETKGVATKIRELEQAVEDLRVVSEDIRAIEKLVGDKAIEDLNLNLDSLAAKISLANSLGLREFKEGRIKSAGSEKWLTFVEAAMGLASQELGAHTHYPGVDDLCLLCQQPITGEARDHFQKLWGFMDNAVHQELRAEEEKIEQFRTNLSHAKKHIFTDDLAVSRIIKEKDNQLYGELLDFQKAIVERQKAIVGAIEAGKRASLPVISPPVLERIADLSSQISAEISLWKREEGEVDTLRDQIREFEHRKILGSKLSEIETFHAELVWLQKASTVGGSTRHITQQYNRMYSSLVTDGYVRIFQEKLDAIGKPFKVHIETRPRKGEVYKQLVLEADESTPQKLMSPEKVLSEGEKRALALADFLTEITLDKVSQGMILDDPVTSLDLTWRQKIASIIAAEAKTRQVIVFTHDLPFLYYLKEASQNHEVSVQHHWIKKGDMDGIPGYIYPNNSPALEQDYRDASKAREHYSKAINASPQEQIDHIRLGYGALRTSYEVLIMNDLLKGVVKRFDERTSFMRLRSILWDESTVNEIVQKCELCSGMMEGHSHSDALSSGPPSSKDLLVEIEAYERLRKEARREK